MHDDSIYMHDEIITTVVIQMDGYKELFYIYMIYIYIYIDTHTHNGILFDLQKGDSAICDNVDETGRHYTK